MPDSALATFAAELKAWRERMELTQNAFADKVGYSLALVSAVEQCKRSPRPEFAARCDEITGAPSVAYAECYGGGRIVEQREKVADLMMVMNLIRSSALSPADSLVLLREIRREHDQ